MKEVSRLVFSLTIVLLMIWDAAAANNNTDPFYEVGNDQPMNPEDITLQESFLAYQLNYMRGSCGGIQANQIKVLRGYFKVTANTYYHMDVSIGGTQYTIETTMDSFSLKRQAYYQADGVTPLPIQFGGLFITSIKLEGSSAEVEPCDLNIGSQLFSLVQRRRAMRRLLETPKPTSQTFTTTQYSGLVGLSSSLKKRFLAGRYRHSPPSSPYVLRRYAQSALRKAAITPPPASYDPRVSFPNYRGWNAPNQGDCGSCFSFSASLTSASRFYTQLGINTVFSQRQVGNCYTSNICGGGDEGQALSNFNVSGGLSLCPDWTFPYVDFKSPVGCSTISCPDAPQYQLSNPVRGFPGTADPTTGTAYSAADIILMVQTQLVNYGPVTMSIGANDVFTAYKSGVIMNAGEQSINHAVTLIGYGTDPAANVDYWLAENSWGPDWGEGGFFRIIRGTNELHCEEEGHSFGTPVPPPTTSTGCNATAAAANCQNMGEPKNDCTCHCTADWDGAQCDHCIKDCGANGVLNSANCSCVCNAGYHSGNCSKAFLYDSSVTPFTNGNTHYFNVIIQGGVHVGDIFLVDSASLSTPSTSADNTTLCGSPTFPFVGCTEDTPDSFQVSTLMSGQLKVWINRYLGKTELSTDKGYALDPEYVTPPFTLSV